VAKLAVRLDRPSEDFLARYRHHVTEYHGMLEPRTSSAAAGFQLLTCTCRRRSCRFPAAHLSFHRAKSRCGSSVRKSTERCCRATPRCGRHGGGDRGTRRLLLAAAMRTGHACSGGTMVMPACRAVPSALGRSREQARSRRHVIDRFKGRRARTPGHTQVAEADRIDAKRHANPGQHDTRNSPDPRTSRDRLRPEDSHIDRGRVRPAHRMSRSDMHSGDDRWTSRQSPAQGLFYACPMRAQGNFIVPYRARSHEGAPTGDRADLIAHNCHRARR
jgi:hypothetical protein